MTKDARPLFTLAVRLLMQKLSNGDAIPLDAENEGKLKKMLLWRKFRSEDRL